jgi:hypothetical protein
MLCGPAEVGRRFGDTNCSHFREEKARLVGNRKKESAFLILMFPWLLLSEYLLLFLGLFFDHEDGDGKFM